MTSPARGSQRRPTRIIQDREKTANHPRQPPQPKPPNWFNPIPLSTFWLYRGREDHPYNVFDFTESRGRDGPASFLKDFSGHPVVDAYGVHDGVYLGATNRIFAACCNTHARRKFVEAKPNDPVAAAHAMSIYRSLYDIEGRGKELSASERLELRQNESVPKIGRAHV